ncbi:conserved hypothetical protein [Treponema paraluiscuniculi Cuniculi A]|uniref:SH3b domain-containing protein n=2 Tax=Treponema paraluiscuniculi TaxID=53435 RepID=F7XS87_TREPU|nr:conserved hypothetical protein [Treponema paraluiscuniculi Cuniculi A]WKC72145.1 hypothetical protein TPLL2_0260 [Treponema paraluiscuniculi]
MQVHSIWRRFCALGPLVPFLLLLFSCTNTVGYGVLQWSLPDLGLSTGDILPVYVRSNVSRVYIVEIQKKKVELPFWQLKLCRTKKEALQYAERLREYRYSYAASVLDGLPLREGPENTAPQVYRLREGQAVKLLWKGTGKAVYRGENRLEGDWFKVMTEDGTTGWCFSHGLSLFDERESRPTVRETDDLARDRDLQHVLNSAWYPEYYRTMVEQRRIDLEKMASGWGLFVGEKKGLARIELPDAHYAFPYSRLVKTGSNGYLFDGSSLSIYVRDAHTLAAQFTDEAGRLRIERFVTLEKTPEEIIAEEQLRRSALLEHVCTPGLRLHSEIYGTLSFTERNVFTWTGARALSPALIPAGAGSTGRVALRCFIDQSLKSEYEGVLSFDFDSAQEWVHFLYLRTPGGLKLEHIDSTHLKDATVLRRSVSPVVLYFAPEGHAEPQP